MTIKTKPATDEYRDGWDRVFAKRADPNELGHPVVINAISGAARPSTNEDADAFICGLNRAQERFYKELMDNQAFVHPPVVKVT